VPRADLRGRHCYLEADAIRDALAAARLHLHDTP
jgi:cysteinyl-tRNA synthetase